MTKTCSFPNCENLVIKRGSLCDEHIKFLSSFHYSCSFCNKKFQPKDHFLRNYINYLNNSIKYCSNSCKTSAKNTIKVDCKKHGNNQDTFGGKCRKCCNENNNREYIKDQIKKIQICKKCRQEFSSPIFNNPLCLRCSNIERMKNNKNLEKPQICSKCNNKFKSIFNMKICNSCLATSINLNNKKKRQICQKCNKEFSSTFIMKICHECSGYGGFNREEFYNSKLNFVSLHCENKIIKFKDIEKYNNISGVYSLWGKDEEGVNKCLNVCQTQNIGNELFRFIRNSNRYKNKTDEELNKIIKDNFLPKNKYNKIKTCRDMNNYKNLNFVLIAKGINSKEEREQIEMQYAYQNKAIFWRPAPGQKLNSY